uniref:Protein kinase domain-containing protein n=1 Tax=Xiphophorus maculatus TaxID=8083 RepID=A0A3B5QPE9_XIPMA
MCNVPSKKTNPTTDITIVMRANRRKTPTGRAAMALNSSRARAKKGRLRRYCPTFVLITCAICRRGNNTPGSSNLPNRENTMDDRGISVKYRWDIWAYLGILLKAVHQRQPSFAELLTKLKNIMEEEVKLNLKLEKYVVLQGKLSVYHTEGFLGEGSYGTVVKCTKLDNEELVAVKVLRKDCFKEGKKEAKILRKILQLDPEKNNLLKFIESFKYKGYLCLAFEILDVSVFDFIKSRGFVPLSLSEIRVIAQQLLVALNALKSAGLVHADIKPDNIMFVNHRSQPLKVKLIDFGLAVKVSKLWFVGTVQAIGYRAPEVILGLKMDESVDMWSLGCSLAYMYLGYNLYPTHCVYEVIRAIVHIHGQPPDDVLKDGMDVLDDLDDKPFLFPEKEQMGRTFIKVRPYFFAYQESAETIIKTSGKSKFLPPGKTLSPKPWSMFFLLLQVLKQLLAFHLIQPLDTEVGRRGRSQKPLEKL